MGEIKGIAKAKLELEELYSGIPDDSVNLTFGDLAEVRPQNPSSEKKKIAPGPAQLGPIMEASPRNEEVSPLTKLPSLDFSRGLEASAGSDRPIHYQSHHLPHFHHLSNKTSNHRVNNDHDAANYVHGLDHGGGGHGHRDYANGQIHGRDHNHHASPYGSHRGHDHAGGYRNGMESMGYDHDMISYMSGTSTMASYQESRGPSRRRPGIPHSNICTVCSTYIYIFRHRCLACGRVYCRQCVGIGMGEMSEGRKCVECLGRRFSQRYIQRAGQVGCCVGYPSTVKQQELKWAEKGPRGSGENRYGQSGMVSRSRSPGPRTPTRPYASGNPQSNSFVVGSPYSPYYSPTNHPLPF